MKYLKISNKGLIVAEDLMLIGSSTKRNDNTKIGMFGSGWKYALAWLIRNKSCPIIFSGNTEIKIGSVEVTHRNKSIDVITVNGEKTSLTTEMGPLWTGWMAIREILSNAIDEGEHCIEVIEAIEAPSEDYSTVYIPMKEELEGVIRNFDDYFAFDRNPNYFNSLGSAFIKSESSPIVLYRKGIRCIETNRHSLVDFSLNNVNINEDRLCSESVMDFEVRRFIDEGITKELMIAILKSDYQDWLPRVSNSKTTEILTELLKDEFTFTCKAIKETAGFMADSENQLIIPTLWYKTLQELHLVPSLFEILAGCGEDFIAINNKDTTQILKILSLFHMGDITIKTGICKSDVFVSEGIAYVNQGTICRDEVIAAMILQKLPVSKYKEKINSLLIS